MDLKNLSDLTRVVIVDNNEEEGRAIQKALDENGVASHFHYFKDKTELSKVRKFPNVRLVFLDLELDSSSRDVKIKANTTLTCLQRLVEPSSHYVLVIWSGVLKSEKTLIQRFESILKRDGKEFYPSIKPIQLNKKDYKDASGNFDYLKLSKAINDILKQSEFFRLFSDWEYQIANLTSAFLRDLIGTESKESISRKVNSLAEAYAGQYSKDSPSKYALMTLDSSFKGALDSLVVNAVNFKASDKILDKDLVIEDLSEKAKINNLLMINEDKILGPGSITKVDMRVNDRLVKDIKANNPKLKRMNGAVSIKLDITPLCDYAQKKAKYNHYIYGLMVPVSLLDRAKCRVGTLARKVPSAYELNNVFMFEDKLWGFMVNLRAVETVAANNKAANPVAGDVWFKLREGIVFDIQQRAASHNSRIGHSLIT